MLSGYDFCIDIIYNGQPAISMIVDDLPQGGILCTPPSKIVCYVVLIWQQRVI